MNEIPVQCLLVANSIFRIEIYSRLFFRLCFLSFSFSFSIRLSLYDFVGFSFVCAACGWHFKGKFLIKFPTTTREKEKKWRNSLKRGKQVSMMETSTGVIGMTFGRFDDESTEREVNHIASRRSDYREKNSMRIVMNVGRALATMKYQREHLIFFDSRHELMNAHRQRGINKWIRCVCAGVEIIMKCNST